MRDYVLRDEIKAAFVEVFMAHGKYETFWDLVIDKAIDRIPGAIVFEEEQLNKTYKTRDIEKPGFIEGGLPYPLVFCRDRYGGVYSGGKWSVWNHYLDEIPQEIEGDDTDCRNVWTYLHDENERGYMFGIGKDPLCALVDLMNKINKIQRKD